MAGLLVTLVVPATARAAAPTSSGSGLSYGGAGHTFDASASGPTGRLVQAWTRNLGGQVASPLIVGSAVVTATTSSTDGGNRVDVQAFDVVTGAPLWPALAVGTSFPTLTSDGTRVFVSSWFSVTAVELATGRALWTRLVSPGVGLTNVAAVSGGLLWVNSGSNSTGLVGLDPATGQVLRRYGELRIPATMALVGTSLYVGPCEVDLTAGTIRRPPKTGCPERDDVTASDGTVVVAPTPGSFTQLSVWDVATGALRYTVPVGRPALGAGQLTVASNHQLDSYDLAAGTPRWSVPLSTRPAAPPVLAGGRALVLTLDGHLRRYALADGALVDDTSLVGKPVQTYTGLAPAMAADSGMLAVPTRNSLTVFSGSESGTPARATAAAQPKLSLPTPVTGPDAADGSQYAQDAGHDGVAARSTVTAPLRLAWTKTLPGKASNALIDGSGRLFVAAASRSGGVDVYRYNRRTGAVIWGPRHLGDPIAQTRLAEHDGVLVSYQYGPTAVLRGLDAATGAIRWTTKLPLADYGYDGYPAVAGGSVFVHSYESGFGGLAWSIDVRTGAVRWTGVARQDYAHLAPAVGGSLAYYSGVGDQLTAFDTATGQPMFTSDSAYDGGGTGSAVLAADRLYLNDYSGGGKVVDAATGQPTGVGMFAMRRPAVDAAHGVMIALQGNRLTAERLSDRTRYWSWTGATPTISPLVANGLVFTGDTQGRLLVFREGTGALVWSDAAAYRATPAHLLEATEPADLTVGAGGLALTSGTQLRVYRGAVDNGPRTG